MNQVQRDTRRIDVMLDGRLYAGQQTVTGLTVRHQYVTYGSVRRDDALGYFPGQSQMMETQARHLLWLLVLEEMVGQVA